ncbi:MAG: GrdX family protein [Lachnospiraceae bacterium]|jgi:hypothetical protein|nr:GrdX family protein [Lachnospiraceae bacterium]
MPVKYFILTNNPMVLEKYGDEKDVRFFDLDFKGIIEKGSEMISENYKLLTHPLSGSIKPMATRYKSMLFQKKPLDKPDTWSVKLISSALQSLDKFEDQSYKHTKQNLEDFSLVDYTLIASAISSAEMR